MGPGPRFPPGHTPRMELWSPTGIPSFFLRDLLRCSPQQPLGSAVLSRSPRRAPPAAAHLGWGGPGSSPHRAQRRPRSALKACAPHTAPANGRDPLRSARLAPVPQYRLQPRDHTCVTWLGRGQSPGPAQCGGGRSPRPHYGGLVILERSASPRRTPGQDRTGQEGVRDAQEVTTLACPLLLSHPGTGQSWPTDHVEK